MKRFHYADAPDSRDGYAGAGFDGPTNSTQTHTIYATGGLGNVVTIANVLVTIILIVAIYADNGSATLAVLAGVGYFGVSTTVALLTLSGTLTHVLINRQQQVTVRRLHQLQFKQVSEPPPSMAVVDLPQLPRTPHADPLPPPGLPAAKSFVAPSAGEVSEAARREAAAWVLQLYASNGEPDPNKVLLQSGRERPGRIRVGAPGKEAKQLLLSRGVLLDLGNGFRLNLVRCPTIEAARQYLN